MDGCHLVVEIEDLKGDANKCPHTLSTLAYVVTMSISLNPPAFRNAATAIANDNNKVVKSVEPI